MSLYLQGTLPWLFDPDSPELRTLAREADARTSSTPCDPDALEADTALFTRLLRERHFGVATGRVSLPVVTLPRAETWGELGALRDELRAALVDEHIKIFGAPRAGVPDDGPAVERDVIGGVLVLRIRRLVGTPDDERLLTAWVAGADDDFAHDRIIVDLRGNSGGNDGHTHTWVSRRLRAVERFCTSAGWSVRGKPLGYWNAVAWRQAIHGPDGASPSLLAQRHDPSPTTSSRSTSRRTTCRPAMSRGRAACWSSSTGAAVRPVSRRPGCSVRVSARGSSVSRRSG